MQKTDFGPILRDIVTFSKYQLDSCQLDACIHMAPFESCMLNKVMRVGSVIFCNPCFLNILQNKLSSMSLAMILMILMIVKDS